MGPILQDSATESPFKLFRKLGVVTESERDSCGSEGDCSTESVEFESETTDELTMSEALDEIESLEERVEGEEQDRILAEEQVFNLQMQLAMLRDGAGIREMTEKELDELYDFHEEGMLDVVEERNYRKSRLSTA